MTAATEIESEIRVGEPATATPALPPAPSAAEVLATDLPAPKGPMLTLALVAGAAAFFAASAIVIGWMTD
ncbi:hypothetical protein [Chthonobacter rhizosphaerae]|uniref:hypothetical protein n=1 Tax=Chthonobacter rhizosphaerae TaxID=2735553 RepID=UPI0015EEFAFD|nr:hypothetical protein [Chthonobacter rhizosphaerae]